jgi:hypothetical protein
VTDPTASKTNGHRSGGPTLAGAKGTRRVRKLQDSILNLQIQVLDQLDRIAVMQHEIKELEES